MNIYYKKHIVRIANMVCKKYEIAPAILQSQRRHRAIVVPRQIIWAITREIFGVHTSLEQLGQMFGGKNHATVIHGINEVKNLCYSDKYFKAMYEELLLNARENLLEDEKKDSDMQNSLIELLECNNINNIKDKVQHLINTVQFV